jgi:Lipase (class 3)
MLVSIDLTGRCCNRYSFYYSQHKGPVYAISVDRINRRVTVTFRGTDNVLAFHTNWRANVKVLKSKAEFPLCLKGKLPVEGVLFHSGFYNYLFGRKSGTSLLKEKTRFEEMYDALRPILRANPGYKLYLTGHSLGGALAIITALYLSAAQSSTLPKPVTCISFGAPRVGDIHFMRAVRQLEESRRLRYLRIIHDNDAITSVPVWQYHHAGIQLRLFRKKDRLPDISYPKQGSGPNKLSLTLSNSLLNNINVQYDHENYRDRIDANKKVLKQRSLNELYADKVLTGF